MDRRTSYEMKLAPKLNSYVLIELMKSYPEIWDQKNPSHKKRTVLDQSWSSIAKTMNNSVENLRSRWKSLRDTFLRELKKDALLPGGLSPDLYTTSTWPYFKALSFLRGQFNIQVRGHEEEYSDVHHTIKVEDAKDYGDMQCIFNEEALSNGENYYGTESHGSGTPTGQSSAMASVKSEADPFLRSLLPHMNKLSADKRMLLQIKMQELVYDFVYTHQ